jgi:TPR repeat protein
MAISLEAGSRGFPKDPDQALAWYGLAALGNVALAQGRLGAAFAAGGVLGLPYDGAEGAKWLERAAAQGSGISKKNLLSLAAIGVPEAVAAAQRLGIAP